jgi:pimeloyl-ACP methyl ester carboxylesterase
VRRGALYEPIPADWLERADLDGLRVPILGIHGSDDPISPLGQVRGRYAAAPSAELVRITAGRHDVLNDQTHRTVAATVVLFLERIRQDSGPRPIAVQERLGR